MDRWFKIYVITWLIALTLPWVFVALQWHQICQRAALTVLEDAGEAIVSEAVKEKPKPPKQGPPTTQKVRVLYQPDPNSPKMEWKYIDK
jgi:hypothetical protein